MDHASSSSDRSTGSSPRHSPISPRLSPESNSSANSGSEGGSVIVYDSESSDEWGSSDSAELEALESFLRKNRCMRYFLEWNVCVDQSIRNGQDHRIQCFRLSRALRNCVRLS